MVCVCVCVWPQISPHIPTADISYKKILTTLIADSINTGMKDYLIIPFNIVFFVGSKKKEEKTNVLSFIQVLIKDFSMGNTYYSFPSSLYPLCYIYNAQ